MKPSPPDEKTEIQKLEKVEPSSEKTEIEDLEKTEESGSTSTHSTSWEERHNFALPKRYQPGKIIGQGGMGKVIEAFDTTLKRSCAIKLIDRKHLNTPGLRQDFQSEAILTASLNHPNVIKIFDVSEDPKNPYFVMEKFTSMDGHTFIGTQKPALPQLLNIFRQVVEGLEAAQRVGLIHRDIKPGNLLIDGFGNVKIIDFGLGKSQNQLSSSSKGFKVVVGSPFYMSPEQCRGETEIDFKTDVYSTGFTFFEFLTGKRPFQTKSRSREQVFAMHCHGERPRLSDFQDDCPKALSDLIFKMMAIQPEKRPDYSTILHNLTKIADEIVFKEKSREAIQGMNPLLFSINPVKNPLAFSAILFIVITLLLGGFDDLENKNLDLLFRVRGMRDPVSSSPIIIAGITDRDMSQIGPLPWDRKIYARLVEKLRLFGAKIIGFNIHFLHKSRNPESDRILADEFSQTAVVLPTHISRKKVIDPITWRFKVKTVEEFPYAEFKEKAASLGYIDIKSAPLNMDGTLRHFSPQKKLGERTINSWIWAVFHTWRKDARAEDFLVSYLNWDLFRFSPGKGKFQFFKADSVNHMIINYRGRQGSMDSIPVSTILSIKDVKEGRKFFKEKIVLVGDIRQYRALDQKSTPFGLMSSTEINANILDTFIRNKPIFRPDFFRVIILLIMAAVATTIFLYFFHSTFLNFFGPFLSIPYWFFTFWVFKTFNWQLPFFSVGLVFIMLWQAVLIKKSKTLEGFGR